MPRDHAYELMRDVLKGLLPSLERIAGTAKNPAARKNLMVQIEQIKAALTAAENASRQLTISRGIEMSQLDPAASKGSEAA
jgi:hypothetical protein